VTVYRALGIDPTYVSIQNEPDETTDYESCRSIPTKRSIMAKPGPVCGGNGCGLQGFSEAVLTAASAGPRDYRRWLWNEAVFTDAVNPKEIYAVTHHLYTGGDKEKLRLVYSGLASGEERNAGAAPLYDRVLHGEWLPDGGHDRR